MSAPLDIHPENIINMFCEECGADFNIEHDMGIRYIPQYCTFCGAECYKEDESLDYEELDSENSDNIH